MLGILREGGSRGIKTLRVALVFSMGVLLVGVGGFGTVAHATGTAEMEATILRLKVVPEAEVTRIVGSPSLCSGSGSEASSDTTFLCEETYPRRTRVNINVSNSGREVTIRDSNNRVVSAGTAVGDTDTVRDPNNEVIAERPNPAVADYSSCGPLDVGCWLLRLPGMLFTGIAFVFLLLSGMILGLAGTVFNWVVIRTVFQFGTYFGTNDGMLIAWGVMRDVANIGLLFGFIFMGVLLILNVDGGGHGGGGMSAKKAIPRLIIFAVLLNFSLFASQAVIDVANAFSSSFATLAGESCTGNTSTGNAETDGASMDNEECSNVGISGQILKVAGLTSIWDSENRDVQKAMKNLVERPYSYAVSLIMLSIFVLITAMVLLAGSILLIIRVVILSLLMVTSPVGFAGMAIPKLQGVASMWWSKLMSQAFFAPVYLLLIFISIKLTEGLMDGEATLANALIANQGNSVAGNMQVVMVFMVVIGFMIGSLIVASKMGAMGAKFATQSVAGATVGFAGFAGRRTLGAASGAVANRIASSSWARSNGLGSRFAYNIANKGATSSYSARTGINNLTKGAGLDIGNADKKVAHGLHGIEEEEVKARQKFADDVLAQTPAEIAEEERLKKAKTTTQNSRAIEQSAWNRQKTGEQEAIETQTNANKTAAQNRLLAIDTQKTRVANAQTGYPDPVVLSAEMDELNRLTTEHEVEVAREEADIQARRTVLSERQRAHETYIRDFDKRISDIDHQISGGEKYDPNTGQTVTYKGVTKDAARRQYAESMEHSGMGWPSIGKHVNHQAAEKIIKKLNRSDNEKLIDAIKESKGSGGGGGAPAPAAPTPAGGGGTH